MEKSLTKKERLILANQYEILSKLTEDEYEKKQYENIRDAFREGFTWGYSLATDGLSEEVTGQECCFVLDVLDMYSSLYFSREKSKEAKDAINEKEVLFVGFDLNDLQECRYFSFYKFLVEDLGRFNEYKEWMDIGKIEGFNSHGSGPSMEKLLRMIQKEKELKRIRHERHDLYFTKEEIQEILNA
ncbi:hypothetical protein GCM10011351_14730 [Paraliobacillus quinghaiensis]|uniref:Uncharacterized protein n=1 Tax=Paraliobacillus quinghaiensis TaxID=470815 RepID=A0A917WT49_9BACI|nr:YfbU family protein [Paraliobacillus quinghaiensis]GGM29655.1 hypothetical protein GCM10011351_14730 [Paraliobacillus quinghaiensis]